MSAHTKKHPTKKAIMVVWRNTKYAIPMNVLNKYKVEDTNSKTIDEAFGELIGKHTKAGASLKGLRAKENLTQIAFAKKLNITQQNLSAMENGRRNIGKEMAKRIAKKFKMDYRLFL